MSQLFDPEKEVFIFCHIPKCGGTSIHSAFSKVFGEQYLHFRPGVGWQGKLESLSGGGGHQHYGSNPLDQKSPRKAIYFTIVRNPIERIRSFHAHVMKHKHHHLWNGCLSRECDLGEFVDALIREERREFWDLQTRFICGDNRGVGSPSVVRDAIDKNFHFIAPLEFVELALEDVGRFLNREVPVLHENKSMADYANIDIDKATIEKIYAWNRADLAAYHYAKEKFVDRYFRRASS